MAGGHPNYGSCDGFGPLWTCSECTGVIGCDNGTFLDAWAGEKMTPDAAAARVGDFLMRRIEMAAVAGWGCSADPAHLEGFMRRSLWFDLPGDPWRRPDLANDALGLTAQGMEARSDKTRSGLAEGDSPVPETKLEPCPFCGSPAILQVPVPGYGLPFVDCTRCSMDGPAAKTEAEAIAAWNTRPAPSCPDVVEAQEAWADFRSMANAAVAASGNMPVLRAKFVRLDQALQSLTADRERLAEALSEALQRYPDARAGLAWFAAASGLSAGEITREILAWATQSIEGARHHD